MRSLPPAFRFVEQPNLYLLTVVAEDRRGLSFRPGFYFTGTAGRRFNVLVVLPAACSGGGSLAMMNQVHGKWCGSIVVILLALIIYSPSAQAKRNDDVVVLKNGDRLTGEIKGLTRGEL